MRFAESRRSKAPVMNVTAFIDVLFLLVLFLLVTAKYDTEGGIAVDLPQGKTQESPQVPDTFDITVMHDGTMFLDKTAVAESELGLEIQKMRGHLKDPVLVIRTAYVVEVPCTALPTSGLTERAKS